jgi:hypothetical protein
LKDLIEFNPNLAVECLVHLLSAEKKLPPAASVDALNPYLQALLKVDLTLHSMEVVNRLTNTMLLPKAFYSAYCCGCITTCENIKDKYSAVGLPTYCSDCLFISFPCVLFSPALLPSYHTFPLLLFLSQSRLVRIVCVFMQSLIRNKVISGQDKDLLVVIETFTIEFSKIKEASTLYRLLKEI